MYIQRELETTLRRYLSVKEILAVVGPRQSGKSTLLGHLIEALPNTHSITFEDQDLLALFDRDIKAFAELHVKKYDYVFIDEIQYSKHSGKRLKYIYDTCATKLLISGSSATELSIHSIRSLVGRIFVFNLYPLSFKEFLQHKNPSFHTLIEQGHDQELKELNELQEEFLLYGGYPRVVLAQNSAEKQQVLKNIYNTYFLREIKEILQLSEDYKLADLIKALALQIGGIINHQELSQLSGFTYSDLKKHLQILEKTFICSFIRNFHTNKRTELVKSPKVFFFDTGFRNEVIKNYASERVDKGQLLENFIFTELIKKGQEVKYWRTKAKAEVDFVLECQNKPVPLEVKSMKVGITRSFRSFLETYSPEQAFFLSAMAGNKEKIGNTTVWHLPISGIIILEQYLTLSAKEMQK